MKFCVRLKVRPGTLNGILDGVANGLKDTLLVVKDDATHAKRASREDVLRFVIDK